MASFEEFRRELRDALIHLQNPKYQPSELLCVVMGCDPTDGAWTVQYGIIQAIEDLEPPPDVPSAARSRRDFSVLHLRFVLKLTQEQTAEILNMSVRSMRRAQREATHVLARLLWERSLAREVSHQQETQPQEGAIPGNQVVDWRSQVRQDLAALQASGVEKVADVKETINYAVALEGSLTARQGISLDVGNAEPNLVAAIHPAALRQVLIMAVAQLARCTLSGQITIHVAFEDEAENIDITLTGPRSEGDGLPDGSLIGEILVAQGGSVQVASDGDLVTFRMRVPSVGEATVLIVDDNLDQVHFYRRCTTGTRYRIVHAAQGRRTVDAIEAAAPDVIVLDIILPDADGWELLAQLHKNPATRSIPIIICSIVKEEDLASALGAALYLPKPVRRREFVRALDQVLDRVPASAPKTQVNSATTH